MKQQREEVIKYATNSCWGRSATFDPKQSQLTLCRRDPAHTLFRLQHKFKKFTSCYREKKIITWTASLPTGNFFGNRHTKRRWCYLLNYRVNKLIQGSSFVSTSCSFVAAGRLVHAMECFLFHLSCYKVIAPHTENDNLKVSRSIYHSHFPTEIASRVMRTQKNISTATRRKLNEKRKYIDRSENVNDDNMAQQCDRHKCFRYAKALLIVYFVEIK